MRIAIPTEVKPREGRVALIPDACGDLARAGHEVWVQAGAGVLSGYADEHYQKVGVHIAPNAEALYAAGEIIVKVKEPIDADLAHLRSDQLLFCYLHLAPQPELTRRLQEIGLTAIAFETVELDDGTLPLLAPMSMIAGRIAVQVGTHLLHQSVGGKGKLLGGLPGTERGRVVVLGGGIAGGAAAALAAAAGAEVTVFDKRSDRLAQMMALGANVTARFPYGDAIAEAVAQADLTIGAVLVTGERAPKIVTEAMVMAMEPGSVLADISVDQGGCCATTRPTTYAQPTYVYSGVIHFAVTNMPGAVPRTASQAISGAVLPYVQRLGRADWRCDRPLLRGVNVDRGQIVHPALCAG